MKRLILIALALPLYLECGPASVPPDAGADLAPLPRLYRDINGELHDRLLDNQRCAFVPRSLDCALRCFPAEPIFGACGADGTQYYYTRQAWFGRIKYGAIRTLLDPRCSGVSSYQLTELVPMRPQKAVDCSRPAVDLSINLFDREWYLPQPTSVELATTSDAPN